MPSEYIDTTAIIQMIGCTFNNPSILDNTDQYNITDEDFVEPFHQVLFGSIYNIHANESDVTLEAIVDYLSLRPKAKAIFDMNKGTEYLLAASEVAHEETFNYYYQRLKKMSLLRAFDNIGLDVTFIYDPSNVIDTKLRQEQEDWLDSASLVEIARLIDMKIDEIRSKFVDDEIGAGYQAGEGIIDLIEDLEKNPEVGIPMFGNLINTVTRGARLRKFYLRSAATGTGKAIPNDTIIPTPSGYRMVKDIQVGDYLFDRNGKPTKVLKVHPQIEKKEIYIVVLSDGRVAKCCKDHLWQYSYEGHRGYSTRVESVNEILERTKSLKNGFKDSCNRGFRFRIPLNNAVEYPEKSLPINPYVFGLFLGDGSFRYSESNKELSFSSIDDELPASISKICNWTYRKNSEHNFNYSFFDKEDGHKIWVEEFLFAHPELLNAYSQNKFIPDEYLMASIEQRYALLQGLLDTDGTIDDKGRIRFTNTSKILIDQLQELCRSLGFITSIIQDNRSDKYTTGICYDLHIQCKKELKPNLFRLKRKKELAINYANNTKRTEHKDYLAIVDIVPTNEYTEMTCFTVDNEEHLFLMNDFIVTHNTRTMVADACYFACNQIYYDEFGWIPIGPCQPTLYITTEQDKSEVQTMMLAFLSNVNEEHILNGRYEEGERERVIYAAELLKKSPIWIEELPDFSLQDVENKIKKYIREHDVRYICHDYIHTSMKILEEITRRSGGVRLREDNVLFMLSTRLKDLCNKYGVFILSATQLNGDYVLSETPDQNLLRGAKSIAD